MAGSIIAIVPWGLLIEKMPAIIDGASRLLRATGTTRRKIEADIDLVASGSNQIDASKLKETVESLEASVLALNKQMTEAAKLIQELAETNKFLVRAGQLHKKCLLGLALLATLSFAVAGVALKSSG